MRIEKESVDKKLIGYSASSYVIDQIVPKLPDAKSAFNIVPTPIWNHYTQKYPDGVEAALNLNLRTVENELPDVTAPDPTLDGNGRRKQPSGTGGYFKNIAEFRNTGF